VTEGESLPERTFDPWPSPTFVVELADGRMIRMSCYCAGGKLDWERGMRLALWVLKDSPRFRSSCPEPVAIWFEIDGRRVDRPPPPAPKTLAPKKRGGK
jgi:hypothetical protein